MDTVGFNVGLLTVIQDLDDNEQASRHNVLCECKCGNKVIVNFRDLKRGRKKSCGCLAVKVKDVKPPKVTKEELQSFLDKEFTVAQMAEALNMQVNIVSNDLAYYGLKPLGATHFNKGDRNGAKRPKVKKAIAKSLKDLWDNGFYSDRIDGMTGVTGFEHQNYKGIWDFRARLSKYQDVNKCSLCGTSEKKIDIHHIDENHENYLITNLIPLCVHCHQKFHYKIYKMPYASVTVESHFSSGHYLPSYNGECHRCHAHGWKYSVTIRGRINPDTGMVLDYKDLKSSMKEMESIIDHRMLNDILPLEPTSENIAVWMWEYLSKRLLVKGIVEIKLYESENCYTTITVQDMLARGRFAKSRDIFIGENEDL